MSPDFEPLEPLSMGALVEVILGLALVLALFMGVAYLLRRVGSLRGTTPDSDLRIVGGLSLSTRDRIVLLEVREHHVLLGLSPGNIRALHVFGPDEIAPPESESFDGHLREHDGQAREPSS
jgi:flagellar protein FliO/FliZ